MMLVEAFLQHKGSRRHLVDLYATAIDEGFMFYSFGDSMLIL
jgi:S-adenosylmethionine:tRNA-ribosyltransferase-isomerase (queuine synthetase)